MINRVLLSIGAALVALVGVVLMDCEWGFVGDDISGMCSTISSFGVTETAVPGIGLALFATLCLVAVWVPGARPGARRRQRDPVRSLQRNIDRIGVVGAEAPEPVKSDPSTRLVARLEALETSLSAESGDATREATEQWMRLLREANDLHNSGEIATEEFRRINTRLLDLFIEQSYTGSRLA